MTRDRMNENRFELTQEFLAQMLGVRRAGVNEVVRKFEREGLIEYQRGVIQIRDTSGLERRACECYGIIRGEYQRLEEMP